MRVALASLGVALISLASSMPTPAVPPSLGIEQLPASGYAAPEGKLQTPDEALAADLSLVAESRGWSYEQALAQHVAANEIGALAELVVAHDPSIFVGTALSRNPGGAPTLLVKGDAVDWVKDLVTEQDLKVTIISGQPYSFAELEVRQQRVHSALRAGGFPDATTGFDILTARMSVVVAGDKSISASMVRKAIPVELRDDVDIEIFDGPVVLDHGAYGGMWFRNQAGNQCTSGFTVTQTNSSVRGIATAAHCLGINSIEHPGHGIHPTAFQLQHEGQWGDVEWHTTGQAEADDFYADSANIRDVSAVESVANISLNEPVCVYGRVMPAATRDCSLEVAVVSQACGVYSRFVMMNGDSIAGPGDSGGPEYFGNKAYGIYHGSCVLSNGALRDAFSPASYFDEAVGVFIPTS